MDPNLQSFAQHLANCHAATTLEQKVVPALWCWSEGWIVQLALLKSAKDYVTTYAPPIDALCLNNVFNLQAFGHLVLFQELLLLVETIITSQPRVELILPVFDFIERVRYGCNDEWLVALLRMCSRLFASIMPHILNGRSTPLPASWRLCWQKMSCLGQSLVVQSLSSPCEEFQLAGIASIEGLIHLYTEPTLLMTAGSGRGAPTADMFLFNCRYLIDRLTERISAEDLKGQTPIAVVQSLTQIVSQREKYFDSLVPHLLRLTERDQYKIANLETSMLTSTEAFRIQMATTLKQSLLSLLGRRVSNRQKSMLLLGLSQLGTTHEAIPFRNNPSDERGPANTSWNYISDSAAETPQAKKPRLESAQPQISSSETSEDAQLMPGQDVAQYLIDKAKSMFHGKLNVSEVQTLFDILIRSNHKDCVLLIADQLNPELVANLVIHGFTCSAPLEVPENQPKHIKPELSLGKGPPVDVEMQITEQRQPAARSTLGPLTMSLGERQMLVEYSSNQLLKNESGSSTDELPLGMSFLSKLSSRSPSSSIPTHVLTEFISQHIQSKPDVVQDLSVQFLFDLFVSHGSSSCDVQDPEAFLKTVETFEESQLQHPYDQALWKILNKLSLCEIEGRDKILKALLLEVPALPPAIVFTFFRKQLTGNASTAMSFLITANALMESQPVLKPVLLECVLETCTSNDGETREKGIRLVKNKLYQDEELAQRIENFASKSLAQLASLEGDAMEESANSPGKYCHLYLALCTRKASLLPKLLVVYGEASTEGKRVIEENAKQLSEAVHVLLPELLPLIKTVPTEAEPLLLLLLSIFPDKSPPQIVIDACLDHYNESKNVHYLVPILPGLPKKRVMELVPLLTQLTLSEFDQAVSDLVGHLPFGDSTIEPGEVLVALSSFSDVQGSPEALNAVRTALDYCIKQMPTIFDKEILAGALNKLVHMHTLPVLFMRMVLLSLSREKDLGAFILQSVLSASVVSSKIKPDSAQWQGYVLLLQKTMPASFRHLLAIPTRLMTAALREMPKAFSERFFEFVESDACDVRAPKDTLLALKHFVTDYDAATQATQSRITSSNQAQQNEQEVTCSSQRPTADAQESEALSAPTEIESRPEPGTTSSPQ